MRSDRNPPPEWDDATSEQWYSVPQILVHTPLRGRPLRTLYRWIQQGYLKAERVNRTLYVSKQAVLEFMANHRDRRQ